MKRDTVIACVLLAALTVAVFAPVVRFDFVHWDDDVYVVDNTRVQAGLSVDNVVWAFDGAHFGYYYPLTWLAHMTDCQLFGLWAGGHHAMSLLVHLANALLLFFLLFTATGATWRSFTVAALFAIHPQHVESVAWISERKDLLSTLFCLLAIAAYARYAKAPTAGRYAWIVVAFAASLLVKPMYVTLPVLLVLVDWWPLERRQRVIPKVALLAALPIFAVATYVAQSRLGAVMSADAIPLGPRVANALISYGAYVVRTFAPVHLSPFYVHPRQHVSYALAAASAAALGLATFGALRLGRRYRWAASGWLWYVVTLSPVIGIIQVGAQGSADRYTYFALIGLFVGVVWGAHELFVRFAVPRVVQALAAAAALIACAVLAAAQCQTWKNSTALFTRMVTESPGASVGQYNFGKVRDGEGDLVGAIASYRKAVELEPRRSQAWINLGIDLHRQGDDDAALEALQRAIEIDPADSRAFRNLGPLYEQRGQWMEAEAALERVTEKTPDDAEAWALLALAYQNLNRPDDASASYREAIKRNPALAVCRFNLGVLALRRGDAAEANEQLSALRALDEKLAASLQSLIDRQSAASAH